MSKSNEPGAYHIVLDEANYDADLYTFRVTQGEDANATGDDLDILVDLDSDALHQLSYGVRLATWGRVAHSMERFKAQLATVSALMSDARSAPAVPAKPAKAVPDKPKGKSTSVIETTTAPAKSTPATPTESKGK